ncbi:MAG: DUF1617 family protein [Actinomycetaceae bacterium]|nr:DUF1617 family protein [Actinomycetaceae bacterium]
MKLAFTNRDLPAVTALLDTLELPPTPSRARTHLLAALAPAIETFSQDEYDLVRLYAQLGEDGSPKVNGDGTITLQDPGKASEFHTEHTQLLSEEVTVEFTSDKAALLLDALNASSQCFTGDTARALDILATSLEQANDTVAGS